MFVHDGRVNYATDCKIEDGFPLIKNKIFFGSFPAGHISHFFGLSEDFFASGEERVTRYFLNDRKKSQYPLPTDHWIHRNICKHGLIDFGSVAFAALHFSLFTYPKRIYLVGCDTSQAGHFYDKPQSRSSLDVRNVKIGYARMKMFARLYYPDTEIISVNPVGLKGLFRDVYTDSYKASLS